MSDATSGLEKRPANAHGASLVSRLHDAIHAVVTARDENDVGRALIAFAADGDLHAARLIGFLDFVDGLPTMLELREGWTVDDRPARPQGIQLPLSEYPLMDHLEPDSVLVCENVMTDRRINERIRRLMQRSGLSSFALIPIAVCHQALAPIWFGTLVIGRDVPSKYDQDLIYAWQTLADQAALSLEQLKPSAHSFKNNQGFDSIDTTAIGPNQEPVLTNQVAANQWRADAQGSATLDELARRSVQLETAADVSRAASSILDPGQLIQQVVELVQERFGLYYTGLFLVDQTGDWTEEPNRWAVLRAGTGEAGKIQLQNGHKLQVAGESMVGWCIANAQARISQDVAEEATRFVNPLLPDTRSEMALPLISRGEVIGAMTIQSAQEMAFSQDDISILQTMADQLANAINNTRLYHESNRRAEELNVLNLIVTTVSRSLEQQEVLDTALQAVVRALGFDAGLISLNDPRTGQLVLSAQDALPATLAEKFQQQGLAGTLCEVVFQTGHSMGLGDLHQGAAVDVSGLIAHGLRAYVGSPITYQSKPLGTFCLFGRSTRDIDNAQLSLLEAIGRQMGIGIENARLFAESTTLARREQALRQVITAISQSDDVLENFTEITGSIAELVPLDLLTLTIYVPDVPTLSVFAVSSQSQAPLSIMRGMRIPLAGSASGWVVEHNQPWLDTDLGNNHLFDFDKDHISEKVVSRLILPLRIGRRVIGTLDLASHMLAAYAETDIPALTQIADQLALAMERARLLEETHAALAEVQATHRRYVSEQWEKTLASDSRQSWGYLDGPDGLSSTDTVWTPEIQQAIDSGELAVVQETPDGEIGISHSGLAVPISLMGQTIGVLDFYDQDRMWTEDDKALVSAVADQVALALENQRLFDQIQRSAQRERLTGQIVGRIRAADAIQDVLETAAEELGRALGVSRARIRIGGPGDQASPQTDQPSPQQHDRGSGVGLDDNSKSEDDPVGIDTHDNR